jgi:hypothetical protein
LQVHPVEDTAQLTPSTVSPDPLVPQAPTTTIPMAATKPRIFFMMNR